MAMLLPNTLDVPGLSVPEPFDPRSGFKLPSSDESLTKRYADAAKESMTGYAGPVPERPKFGYEAYVEDQTLAAGGRRLRHGKGATYRKGPYKGMSKSELQRQARADYAAMSPKERAKYESMARMEDVTSADEQQALKDFRQQQADFARGTSPTKNGPSVPGLPYDDATDSVVPAASPASAPEPPPTPANPIIAGMPGDSADDTFSSFSAPTKPAAQGAAGAYAGPKPPQTNPTQAMAAPGVATPGAAMKKKRKLPPA